MFFISLHPVLGFSSFRNLQIWLSIWKFTQVTIFVSLCLSHCTVTWLLLPCFINPGKGCDVENKGLAFLYEGCNSAADLIMFVFSRQRRE